MTFRPLACLSLVAISCATTPIRAAAPTLTRPERIQLLQSKLLDAVRKMQSHLKSDPAPVEIRDVTNGALIALVSGDAHTAESLMRLAFDTQDMKPGDTFGTLPWNVGTRDIHDANAIDFGTEALGPFLAGHSKDLSADFQQYIRPHATASLAALARQPILVSYSNIYTMNFTNIILIAEWLGDEPMKARGYAMLDNWLDYTGRAGIHEFDSPTYNAVVLNSLYVGYQYSSSASVRDKYHKALDYLWTDLTANYFEGGHKLGGAHSRDYDFLFGQGSIEAYFFLEGFQDQMVTGLSLERAFLLESTLPTGYRSPFKHFGTDTSRVITQRWDENLQRYRYSYITPGFAMGIANGQYGPQDKMFAVDFAPDASKPAPLPTIYLATTTTGIPYGRDRTLDRSGHSKPKHLTNGLAAVQEKGLALIVADADPKSDKRSDTFTVDMVLPSAATATVNGDPIQVNGKLNRSLKPGEVIGVRVADTCFAMLPFASVGAVQSHALQADPDGLDLGAFRYSTVFKAPNHTEPMQTAYLVLTQACAGTGNSAVAALRAAKVTTASLPHQWTVDASLGATSLEITYDLEAHASSGTKVNGTLFVTAPLHVLETRSIKQAQ